MLTTRLKCQHCGGYQFHIEIDPRNGNAEVVCKQCGTTATKVSVYSMQEDFDAKNND